MRMSRFDWSVCVVKNLVDLCLQCGSSGGPDRVTRFLEPGQNFQILMKMDKNLIFARFF